MFMSLYGNWKIGLNCPNKEYRKGKTLALVIMSTEFFLLVSLCPLYFISYHKSKNRTIIKNSQLFLPVRHKFHLFRHS